MKTMYSLRVVIYLAFLWLFLPGALPAIAQSTPATLQPAQLQADAQNIRLVSQTGGRIQAFFVVGARLYLGEGLRLTVLDVSDPSQPIVLGKSAFLPAAIRDLVVVGETAYIADDDGGLRILDISNPALPLEVGDYPADSIEKVTVAGDLAFLAAGYSDGGGELRIINIQNPAAPVLLGTYFSPADIGDVAVVGTLAYFNDTTGLRILDIHDPTTPTEINFYPVTGGLQSFQVAGDQAFLAAGANGLRILDLNDPAHPQEIGAYDSPGTAVAVDVFGSEAYLADGPGGLQILNVNQPTDPTVQGVYTSTADITSVSAVGKQAYALDNLNRVLFVNATNAAQPLLAGNYAAPPFAEALYVDNFFGQYAYVANGSGLSVVKLDGASGPMTVGQAATSSTVYGITGDNNYSYLAAYDSGLRIMDVHDPANPHQVGFLDTPGSALDVLLRGGDVYVADDEGGLRIINVRDPANPVETGFFDVYTNFCCAVRGVSVAGDFNNTYAYLADGDLRIVDVTNPVSPQQVGFLPTPGSSLAIAVAGDYAYLVEEDHFLRVINISNPTAPVQVAALRYQQSGLVTFDDDIVVSGNEAYISDGSGVVRVFNITNPASPSEIAYYDTKQYINQLYVIDKTIYLAGGINGLMTMHYPACYKLIAYHTGKGADPLLNPDNSPGCPTSQFVPQAFVTLSANPAPDWRVGRWLGTDNDNSPLTTNKLTMPAADYTVQANYVTPCYHLGLTQNGSGSAPTATPTNSATCPPGQYSAGEALSLHASPASGWRITQWTGAADATSTAPENTLIMPANLYTVSVLYASIPVTVTGDAYEEDNRCTQARLLTPDGVGQDHSFHRPGDEDWLRVATTTGGHYRIEVNVPGDSPADVNLELYNECTGALVNNFAASFSPGVRLDITRTTGAPFYLRLSNMDTKVGSNSFTYQVSVRNIPNPSITENNNQALILVGGSFSNPDRLQKNIDYVTDAVYAYFRLNGYDGADITYLSNSPSVVNRTGDATRAALQAAITIWARQRLTSGGQLTLYLMDHGDQGKFYLNNAQGQVLNPQQLDGWLDELETAIPELKVTVIIEACYSGSFIEGDQSISKDEPGRLVLTSTTDNFLAYASANGAYFSDFMLASLQQGYSLPNSFKATYGSVRELSALLQEPWLDGNGNGIPNELADIALATQRSGSTNAQGWAPYIVSAQPPKITNRRGVLQAVVRDDKKVHRVWAVIKPPSYHPPQQSSELVPESLTTIVLTAQGNDTFAATYPGFDEVGNYQVTLYAEDEENLVALPKVIEVAAGNRLFLPVIRR